MNHQKRRAFLQSVALLPACLGAQLIPDAVSSAPSEQETDYGSCDPWVEVSLKNIGWNVNLISRRIGGRPILAVLKCNAYGHGLIGVGRFLEQLPVHGLAVGKLSEALALRRAGIKCPVLNFGPFMGADVEKIIKHKISQTVYSDEVLSLNNWAGKIGARAGVHIEVDTGLGRVGIPYSEAFNYLKRVSGLENIKIEGIFQVFSEDKDLDVIQLRRFLDITDRARKAGISVGLRHASSSAGVLGYSDPFYLDMVRPGISIYGHYPSDEEDRLRRIELRPALTLKSKVNFVKNLKRGESLSYGRKFVADKAERVATVTLGYSDGVPMNIPDHASALVRGKKFPLFGDLTSNHSYLKVTGETEVRPEDDVVIIGRQENAEITLMDLSRAVGLSTYKVLINLNPGLKRVFLS